MEDLSIFRIFLAFPFIGLSIPDAGRTLSNLKDHIPLNHIIIEATLLICILVCTAGIMYAKHKLNNLAEDNDALIA